MNIEPLSPEDSNQDEQADAREAIDRLNQANRILTESSMLPKEGFSAEQVASVIENYKRYTAQNNITTAKAAKQVGYSSAVMSSWASGTYKGNLEAVTRAVNDWIERDSRRNAARPPREYVSTWLADSIRSYAYTADKRTLMAAIVAPAGSGKSMVLRCLATEMRGLLITCHQGMSIRDLYRAIAVALGYTKPAGTRGELLKFIVDTLAGTAKIIFLDEAHQLGRQIGAVRAIHDQARVPIVMAGTDEILGLINDRAHGRGQFSSRCMRFNALEFIQNAENPDEGNREARPLFTIEEIAKFFASKRMRIDRDGMKMLWALACLPNFGCLRLAENIVGIAMDAEPGLELVTRAHVMGALQNLTGGESIYLQRLAQRHIEIDTEGESTARKVG